MNSIHPTAIISGDVRMGEGNTIGPHAVIVGPVAIGDGNWFGTGVVIGAPPEVRSLDHPFASPLPESGAGIAIGDRNIVREYAQIHQGWHGVTTVSDDTFLMNQVYVAHDCSIASGATFASSVLLAGHVVIGANANLGMGAAVHQRRSIGAGAMVGMGSIVTRDIPPFAKAYGNPAVVHGANVVGMERRGMPADSVSRLSAIFAVPPYDGALLDEFAGDGELAEAIQRWRASLQD
jgi:UDP-N-acetylglucosamine acyltransferase